MKPKEKVALMGKIVKSKVRLGRVTEPGTFNVDWKPIEEPVHGWVVGFRTYSNGRIVPGTYDDPTYFATLGTSHRTLLVVPWYNRKAIPVPEGCFEITEELPPPPKSAMHPDDREFLRQEMKKAKRDERGRWLPVSQGGR